MLWYYVMLCYTSDATVIYPKLWYDRNLCMSPQSSLLDPLDHPRWSLFSNHQLTPVSRSQTAPSGMLHLTCGRTSSYAVRVPYQFDLSSSPNSSPSSYSDPGPLVGLSRGVFHFRLKTLAFSKSFPPISLPEADFLELWPLVVWQSLAAIVLVSAADYRPAQLAFMRTINHTYLRTYTGLDTYITIQL